MAVIYISEAEATEDFSRVMAQVRAGNEVVIEAQGASALMVSFHAHAAQSKTASATLRELRSDGLWAPLADGYAEVLDESAMQQPISLNPQPKLLSEALKHAREVESGLTLDDQFGADLEAVIRENRRARFAD